MIDENHFHASDARRKTDEARFLHKVNALNKVFVSIEVATQCGKTLTEITYPSECGEYIAIRLAGYGYSLGTALPSVYKGFHLREVTWENVCELDIEVPTKPR